MEEGVERCLPAYTSRRSDEGREVRTESSVVRFCIDRSEETVMGKAAERGLVSIGL